MKITKTIALISMLAFSGAAFAQTPAPAAAPAAPAATAPAAPAAKGQKPRTAKSLECSKQADTQGLHGKPRLVLGCLIANWCKLPAGKTPRLGVVTSKKIGNAPARSRARRLLRESFRRHQHDLVQPVELVLVARHSIAGRSFAEVEKDFLAALQRAKLLKN